MVVRPDLTPAGLALSPDGGWLLGVFGTDEVRVYPVSETGFGAPTRVTKDEIDFRPGDVMTWMPSA
jgi:hypothetical protein